MPNRGIRERPKPALAAQFLPAGVACAWFVAVTVLLLAAGCGELLDPIPTPEDRSVDYPRDGVGDGVVALYVAPWGADGAVGTHDDPFGSLLSVAERVRPGDVVFLRGGVYDTPGSSGNAYVSVEFSGTASAPITVRSYPGERAVIDGSRHPLHPRRADDGHPPGDPNLLRFIGEHTVWEDITLRHGAGQGLYIVGNHNVFRNIVSHDHHSDGIYLQGSYNLIENCDSFNNYSISNGGNSADGLKMVDGNHIRTLFGPKAETRGNIVSGCRFWNNSDDGIDIWSSLDTLIEYTVAWSNGYGPTGNGMGYKLGNGSLRHSGTVIRYSVGYDNLTNFTTNGATGVTFVHNTSWNPRGTIGFDLRARTAPEDGSQGRNYAYNNLSSATEVPAATRAPTDSGPSPVHTHNSWNLDIDDPKHASLEPSSTDFLALSRHSPAIGAGKDLGHPYDGAAPDLGALQHGETIADLRPDEPTTTATNRHRSHTPVN